MACLMFAQEHDGHLPLAGSLYTKTSRSTPLGWELAGRFGDTGRRRYQYAPWPELSGAQYPIPWNAAISNYLARSFTYKSPLTGRPVRSSVIPTDSVDGVEDAINSASGPWRFFMCPSAGTIERGSLATGGFNPTPGLQATVLSYFVGIGGTTNIAAWSSNTDYVVNEGLLGWDSVHPTYRRLMGKFGGFRDPSSVILMTDGHPRMNVITGAVVPANSFDPDGWATWCPIDVQSPPTAPSQVTNAVPLSGACPGLPGVPVTVTQYALVSSPQNFDLKRHKGKINIVFVDGHCETRKINIKDLSDVYILPRP
jgi:prepilin-type processing-associated H-X9-DG protein